MQISFAVLLISLVTPYLIFNTTSSINQPMFTGKVLRAALDKFMKGEVAANARVQVILPNGEFYDITGVKLLENKIIGVRETHRLAITISPEQWKMGKVIKKL